MTMRRGGFTDEDDRLAKLLMAEFERVEHRPVTASWVATFADMARAVRLDRELTTSPAESDEAARAIPAAPAPPQIRDGIQATRTHQREKS